MLQRPARFAIFDLDGILLDTEPIYTRATNRVLSGYGKQLEWPLKQRMMGRAELEAARILVDALELPIDASAYLAARRPWLQQWFPDAPALAGAQAFTEALARRGLPMAIATSSEARLLAAKTTHHTSWFRLFQTVVCGDDPRLKRAKPAPDIFLLAAEGLQAPPSECVVFEDSPAGVAAGKAAGMQVVAIPDPNVDRSLYTAADLVVSGYAALTVEAIAGAERRD